MNEAFSQLLGALKSGDGKIPNKLKIGEQGPITGAQHTICLLYTSPSPRDNRVSRMPSSA